MTEVKFYDYIEENQLKFAVIIARTQGKWVFCKHKERTTLEAPGGRREPGEDILTTAKRELYEETGAIHYDLKPISIYSVTDRNRVNESGEESFGMLYYADIYEFEKELHNEIEQIIITAKLPKHWTYPLIQPKLLEYAKQRGII